MNFSTVKGSFLVILSAFIFGLSPVLIKFAYRTDITPFMLSVCCYFLATIIFTGYFVIVRYPFKISGPMLLKVFLLGIFLRGGLNMCFFIGYQYIAASLGELIFYLYPAFTLIIAHFYLNERITLTKGLAVMISFGGCFFILQEPSLNAGFLGVILLLLAAVFNAMYMSIGSALLKTISPLLLSYYSGIGCCFTFVVAGLFTHTLNGGVSGGNIGFIIAIAIGIVLAMVLFLSGITFIGAGRSALLCTFEPVATILFSVILLSERLTMAQIFGGLLVIMASMIAVMPQKGREKKSSIEKETYEEINVGK